MTATPSVDRFAFPAGPSVQDQYRGITKREYFANSAMTAIVQSLNIQGEIEADYTFVAEQAFSLADAMVARDSK